jgi:uncharacterized protein
MNELEIITLDDAEITRRGIRNWPVWEKKACRFPYIYQQEEHCFFLEGEVNIETASGKFTLKAGDFAIFRKGLKCIWDIRQPVKKHYNFE